MIDIAKSLAKSPTQQAELQKLIASQTENEQSSCRDALVVPTGKPLSIFDPAALPSAYTEFLFGDCVPFLKRETPVTLQQIFDALPSREELEYHLDSDEDRYLANDRSRWDTPEFYAAFASILRSLKILQSVKASFDRRGFEQDFKAIATTTSQDFVDAVLHPSVPKSNEDLMRNNAGNEKVRTALRHLNFSTATVPLTDGNKMRLHHFGCALNQVFDPLSVFHTQNYADNYSPDIVKLQSSENVGNIFVENTPMPTLQHMHQKTAASPRSTVKLFLLLEELVYRHAYRVDRAMLGNFKIRSPHGTYSREDDFASNGLRGLADFVTALFKCIESQARGFAHGHGKVHSIPDGTTGLRKCLKDVVDEIERLKCMDEDLSEDYVKEIAQNAMDLYNQKLIRSASTRQYESSTLPARQMGVELPEAPFSAKQQRQSRYDGGVEEDGVTKRPLVPIRDAEPCAHIAAELNAARASHRAPRNIYREVDLTGCQLCTSPHYLLPHSFGQPVKLKEQGEVYDTPADFQLPGLPWKFDSETGELEYFMTTVNGDIADAAAFERDAKVFEQCFGRDVRFLHHHNHDHDCSTTCIKNMKKKSGEEMARMLKVNRAPPCRFGICHTVTFDLGGKRVKIRRRGKEIVKEAYIRSSTSRNELGSVAFECPQPFRTASNDCILVTIRCNNDWRDMRRGFPQQGVLEEVFRCDVAQLVACFKSVRAAIQAHKAVQHMAKSIVALHVTAKIVDYYITKYAAKPMEQLQNLVTQYALGLRRLELEEKENKIEQDYKSRGRRVLLRLQYSANRSKWISSTECALYVHTEQQHWTSHNESILFLSRPLYVLWECKRSLACGDTHLTRPDVIGQFAQLTYVPKAVDVDMQCKQQPCLDANIGLPLGISNIGNTCYVNAVLQCLRQILARIPVYEWPKRDTCPLALPLRQTKATWQQINTWSMWQFFDQGEQDDADRALRILLDTDEGGMHCTCCSDACYGALLKRYMSFKQKLEKRCTHCRIDPIVETSAEVVFMVPASNTLNEAMAKAMRCLEPSVECNVCGQGRLVEQTSLTAISEFLVVVVTKEQNESGCWMDNVARVYSHEMQRIAGIRHITRSENGGHYTATICTPDRRTIVCDDETILQKANDIEDDAWSDMYVMFLQKAKDIEDDDAKAGQQIDDYEDLEDMTIDECDKQVDLAFPQKFENVANEFCSPDEKDSDADDGNAGQEITEDMTNDECDERDADAIDDAVDVATNDAMDEAVRNHECDANDDVTVRNDDMEVSECRITASRHDDWLHRGPFLADLTWYVYMMRVRRVRKPIKVDSDYSELFFFDKHYSLSALYCQRLRMNAATAIPRMVGSVCPAEEEDKGEPHAAFKLMLFSRARCPGRDHCSDPLTYRCLLMPSDKPENKDVVQEKPLFAPCWKVCKCEMDMKSTIAIQKENEARKIAVLADTSLMKDLFNEKKTTDARIVGAFKCRPLLLKILALHFDKHKERMPCGIIELADRVSVFLFGMSMYKLGEQLHMSEFVALEMQRINCNIDMDILVRKKPFREEKQGGFINDVDSDIEDAKDGTTLRSEFVGGLGEDACEEIDDLDGEQGIKRKAIHQLNLAECQKMLRREAEIARLGMAGRPRDSDVQMRAYADVFGPILNMTSSSTVGLNRPLLEASRPIDQAKQYQQIVAKEMRSQQLRSSRSSNTEIMDCDIQLIVDLMKRNAVKSKAECALIPLDQVLQGPGIVARRLIERAKETLGVQFNKEQLLVIALCIWQLEQAWQQQKTDLDSKPVTIDSLQKLPNDLGLARILIIGGGGCGKTTIMQAVIVPVLRTFFSAVVLTAPSNRAARGFDPSAKTLHSIAGMKPQDSFRTSNLHIHNDRMRKRMDANQTYAGAWIHDEVMQTSASLFHAAALRTTYARQHVYKLDNTMYAKPNELFGRISFFALCGDHLQLPPVPKSSGLLASLENTSDEHKAGASMFNNIQYLFEMETMKRFNDNVLISILSKMRTPRGVKLTEDEWTALRKTEIDPEQIQQNPEQFLEQTNGWYESCYLWTVVSMACYTRAMASARRQNQKLLICQAVDYYEQLTLSDSLLYKQMLAVPNVATTSRLPGMVLLHIGMRVRLTTQILPPWAVQDATGEVMQIHASEVDNKRYLESQDMQMVLFELPSAVLVKLDNCDREFLPPLVCSKHQVAGYDEACCNCQSFQGWVLIEAIGRTWTFTDSTSGTSYKVSRSQLPLMPAEACPLYSLQGATCDPGLIAHFSMPKRADDDIKWLIVYVLLSRVRGLANLRSIGLTSKIRKIIEAGPPGMLAENFDTLFRAKIEQTKKAAMAAKDALGWNDIFQSA